MFSRGLSLLIILNLLFLTTPVRAENDLQTQIKEKNKELEEINNQINETQGQLEQTKEEGRTIESEVKRLGNTISQLNLGIKSATVSINKLDLELNDLSRNITDIEQELGRKNNSVTEVLKEIQLNDAESPLLVFLRSNSLTEGMNNIQNLLDLNNQLKVEAQALRELRDKLSGKKQDRSQKREEVEIQNKTLQTKKTLTEEKNQERKKLLSLNKKEAEAYSAQLTELEERREEIANEIQEIESRLTRDLDRSTLPTDAILESPVKNGTGLVTQEYGRNSFSIRAYASGFHNGIDFGVPVGTPLLSGQDGEVVAVGNQDNYCYRGAYGIFVVIKHTNGLTAMYAHLSRAAVKVGQKVKRGDLVAYSGHSGYSTGPHLHYTIYSTPYFYMGPSRYCGPMPFGAHLNPRDYLVF